MIEQKINTTEDALGSISFQSEEANTDKGLKEFFKKYMLANNHIKDIDLTTLNLTIDSEQQTVNIEDIKAFEITEIYLPSELTNALKAKIKASKGDAVYTKPDLYLEISNGEQVYYQSLELKSTKKDEIPGSSINQVDTTEWVVFVKRGEKDFKIVTGYYLHILTGKLPFPDRAPRPIVGYNVLIDWNKENRTVDDKKLTIVLPAIDKKIEHLVDWQDYLATEWLRIVGSKELSKNEKWFNNAIRKFAVKFLEYTEGLSTEEKEILKNRLNSLIK
jgi:hypothetical protein